MSKGQKILTYLMGAVIGCLILLAIPRDKPQPKVHPWHAQTAVEGTYPMEIIDDLNRTVRFEKQPRHLISLAPSVTEMLFAMGMGDHLLAVTEWCTYPEEARALRDAGAQIGSMDQPNREMIASYRPELIIGTDLTPREIYAALENPPRTLAVALSHDSMEDILTDIKTIGQVMGVPGKALRLIQSLKADQAAVEARLKPHLSEPKRRVLFLLSIEENAQAGWAPGAGTWIDDLIEASHATNVAAELGQSWGEVSFESLLALDPEVLLVRDAETPAGQQALRDRIAKLPEHPVWRQVKAIETGRIHILPHGPLNIPGPRAMDAYASVADAVWAPQSGQMP